MKLSLFLTLLVIFTGCDNKRYRVAEEDVLLSAALTETDSSTAGNLMSTAIKEVNKLDVVFYPKQFVKEDKFFLFNDSGSQEEIENILSFYPEDGDADTFYLGTLKGKYVKKFLFERSTERYNVELDVAGVKYYVNFKGGFPLVKNFALDNGQKIKDDEFYRVAISKYFFRSGNIFPFYYYRNNLNFHFNNTFKQISASASLNKYLGDKSYKRTLFNQSRAKVEQVKSKYQGFKKISEVQGKSHLSPFLGDTVTVEAVVTAVADITWYPGGKELFLQEEDADQDQDNRTSEGLHVYLSNPYLDVKIGDKLKITGQVYEDYSNNGLTRTELRNPTEFKVLSSDNALPSVLTIGVNGQRSIPLEHISTYKGNINFKKSLKLTDGIDFWESLEGMRVQISNPRVMGFIGGNSSLHPLKTKRPYLTLNILPDGASSVHAGAMSSAGGMIPTPEKEFFNPSIITMGSESISKGVDPTKIFKVGDMINGEHIGIVRYQKNLFGSGEFNFIMPEVQQDILDTMDSKTTRVVDVKERPVVNFINYAEKNDSADQLEIASYNIENMSALTIDTKRVAQTGKAISHNMGCPDVVGLVEVQDNNGLDFVGGSDATETIQGIIDNISCPGKAYKALDISPMNHTEGGIPGGNIRTSMIYDANKLGFTPRGNQNPDEGTVIGPNGSISNNPGRIDPNNEAFARSRKTIIAEFTYRGRPLFVAVNHFNSKRGDTGHWSNIQPVIKKSEKRRSHMAKVVSRFLRTLELVNEEAGKEPLIAAVGDFNAHINEVPMKIFEDGGFMTNLMKEFVAPEDRYTTNHRGNSQPLDYIFVNKNLLNKKPQMQIPHINSDYMGKISDHDPVASSFFFN